MNWSLSERYRLDQESVVPAMPGGRIVKLGVEEDAVLDSVKHNAGRGC